MEARAANELLKSLLHERSWPGTRRDGWIGPVTSCEHADIKVEAHIFLVLSRMVKVDGEKREQMRRGKSSFTNCPFPEAKPAGLPVQRSLETFSQKQQRSAGKKDAPISCID